MPDQMLQIHSIDTQAVVQTIEPPPIPENITDPMQMLAGERRAVTLTPNGFIVPHASQAAKLRTRRVKLLGRSARPGGRATKEIVSPIDLRDANGRIMASVADESEDGRGYNVQESVATAEDRVGSDSARQVQDVKAVEGDSREYTGNLKQGEADTTDIIEDRTDVAVVG